MMIHEALTSMVAAGVVVGVTNLLMYFISMGKLRPVALLRAWAFMLMAALTLLAFRLINRTNPEWVDHLDDWGIMLALVIWVIAGTSAVYVTQTRIGGRPYWAPLTVAAALAAAAASWHW